MSIKEIRNAVEMTTQPELSQLLALLIEHRGLTISAAATLLGHLAVTHGLVLSGDLPGDHPAERLWAYLDCLGGRET